MSELMERRLFSVEEYHGMVEVGILRSEDRIELIGGELVTKAPIGQWHASRVGRLNALFQEADAQAELRHRLTSGATPIPRQLSVVHDGTDLDRPSRPSSRHTLRQLGIPVSAPLVVQVAQLVVGHLGH